MPWHASPDEPGACASVKGHLQMIGRGLKLDVEDRTEEELRGMLTDLWRSWTPEMILDKLMPYALLSTPLHCPTPALPVLKVSKRKFWHHAMADDASHPPY
jgi:hypothetical protein